MKWRKVLQQIFVRDKWLEYFDEYCGRTMGENDRAVSEHLIYS
jgi:hypothetical protein